ncbi:MAG: hypothetical protein ACO1N9_06845 [Flavobacterium sp.]
MKHILLLLIPVSLFAQKMPLDTIYGKVESVREKLIYLDSVQQGVKLFSSENEWGHYGFQGREFALQRNYTFWYELPWAQYVNYYRVYNQDGRIISEKWFSKNNRPLTEYRYQFDKKGNKIQEEIYDESGMKESVIRWGYDYQNKLIS